MTNEQQATDELLTYLFLLRFINNQWLCSITFRLKLWLHFLQQYIKLISSSPLPKPLIVLLPLSSKQPWSSMNDPLLHTIGMTSVRLCWMILALTYVWCVFLLRIFIFMILIMWFFSVKKCIKIRIPSPFNRHPHVDVMFSSALFYATSLTFSFIKPVLNLCFVPSVSQISLK